MEAVSLNQEKFIATKEEYLYFEDQALNKSEYFNGEVIAMSGGTINHNTISLNIATSLKNRLKSKDCRVFNSDNKLDVEWINSYYYPDAMVVCGQIELTQNRKDILKNPVLVVEVLSPSSVTVDKGPKFDAYLALPTLKEYVIIHQDKILIEVYFKLSDNEWKLTLYNNQQSLLKLQSIETEIPVSEVYEDVTEF